jgi:hypothetical protein
MLPLVAFMRRNLLIIVSFFLTLFVTAGLIVVYFILQQQLIEQKTTVTLIRTPWYLAGNKMFSVKKQTLNPHILDNKDTLLLTYNLHGLCMLQDAAFTVSLQDTHGVLHNLSLKYLGKDCYNGNQTVSIPINQFSIYEKSLHFNQLLVSFWYPTTYSVALNQVVAYGSVLGVSTEQLLNPQAIVTISPTEQPVTPTPTRPIQTILPIPSSASANFQQSWPVQSVSSMKETKDRVCTQRSQAFIEQWVDTAKDLGANYVAVETPYDSPSCGSVSSYTKLWISVIRSRGLHVWHRHMFTAFEGIYSTPKDITKNYLQMMAEYIKANPDEFQPDDIFTPIPEPQNGGIAGVTYCPQNICMFSSAKDFNVWLRDAMDVSQNAFASIGLKNKIKVGYFGFDGFVTWGNNNPQWHGILETATVKKMGNITIDHYPEIVGDTMQEDLDKLQKKYPKTPIIIGEWGTITGINEVQDVIDTMSAAKRKNIVGFNYWQMGMDGNEALINDDFSRKPSFSAVQSFYKSSR